MNFTSIVAKAPWLKYEIAKRLLRHWRKSIDVEALRLDITGRVLHVPEVYVSFAYQNPTKPPDAILLNTVGLPFGFTNSALRPHPLAPIVYSLKVLNADFIDATLQSQAVACWVATRDEFDDYGYLKYGEEPILDIPTGNMASALAQGLALSLGLRLESKGLLPPGDVPLLHQLAKSLLLPIREGGVMREVSRGFVLEEYPGSVKYAAVLNGWLSAVIGLLEYEAVFPGRLTPSVQIAYDTLISYLPRYVRRLGHRYSEAWSRLSGGKYPMLVAFQVLHLSCILKSPELAKMAQDWSAYVFWPHAEARFSASGAKGRFLACLASVIKLDTP